MRLTLNTGETVTVSTSAAGNSLTGTYTVGSSITDVADLEVSSIALGSATDTNVPKDIAGNAMGSVSVSPNDYKFTSIEVDTTADVVSAPDSELSVSVKAPGDQLINGTEDDGVVFVVSGLDTDIQSATLTVTDGAGQVRTGAVNLGTGEATIDMSTLTVNAVQQLELAATVSVVDDAGNTYNTSTTPVGLLLDRSADVGPTLGVSFVTGDDVASTINGTASSHGSTDIVNAKEMPSLGLAISGVDLNDAAVIKARINPTDATHQASALTVTSDLAALGQINEYAAALAASDSPKIAAMTGAGFNPSTALTTDLLTLSLDGVSSNIPAGGVVTLVLKTNQAGSTPVTVTLSDTNSDGVYTSVESGGLSATDLYQLGMAAVNFSTFTVVPSTNFTLFAQPTFADSGSNTQSVFESLTDGTISAVVEVIDAAQNFASSGSPVTTQLDRQVPSSPTASLADSGLAADDGITKTAGITATGETGAAFEYLLGTSLITNTAEANAASVWSSSQPSLATDGTADGSTKIFVRQIDAAGNVGPATEVAFDYDTQGPTADSVADSANVSTDGTAVFRVTLSEPVQASSVETGDFESTVTGAGTTSAGSVTGVTAVGTAVDGGYTVFDVTVTGAAGDAGTVLSLALKAGASFTDVAGNLGGSYSAGAHQVGDKAVDTVHPAVSSIERVDTASSDTGASATDGHTNADTVIFKVTFSENVDVTTLQPTDFELQAGTVLSAIDLSLHQDAAGANALTTNTNVVYLKATGASLVDYEGSLSVDLGAGASFEDVIGNASGASADDSASPDESYLFDNSVSATVTVAETLMKGGDTSDVTVVFSDAPASASDFTLTAPVGSGSFSNIQQDTNDASGKTYTATFTASNTVNLAAAEISVTSFTDGAGNVLSGVDTTLDTVQIDNVADHGSNLSVTVAPLDKTASATEAGHVSVAIDGIDTDYHTVTVSISDGTTTVTETATHGGGGWVVPTLDVSTLQDQTLLIATVTTTDLAGNVATATDELFLDMSADAEGASLDVAMIGTGQAPYDGPVGFQIEGVDLNDVVRLDLGLSGPNGSAGLSISVDPLTLGITGLGLLGKAVSMADKLSSAIGLLDDKIGSTTTNYYLGEIEGELGINAGTLRKISAIDRADVADAMHSVGLDPRLEDLVRSATAEELENLADSVATSGDVQALINQTGSLVSVGEVIGVINALGADGSINISFADVEQLISVNPADVTASAETGWIHTLTLVATPIAAEKGYTLPNVDSTLTRLAAAMDRPVGDVELTGADTNVGGNDIHLMIETVGGTHTVTGVSDHVGLALQYDSGTNKYVDGLSARDFLSIAQNLVTLTDSNGSAAGGDPVVGLDSSAFMRLVLDWTTDDVNFSSPFTELGRGEVTATVTVTDLQANQASASTSDYVDPDFTLDESADSVVFDGNPLTITVAQTDIDANFEESDDVTVTLSGIDSDAASVTVTVSGAGHADVTATATPTGSSWTTDLNLRGFTHDQQLSITAAVTDEAGNTATVTASNAITLDKVADGGITASASFVDGNDSMLNAAEAAAGAVKVSNYTDGATDVASLAVSVGIVGGAPQLVILADAPPSQAELAALLQKVIDGNATADDFPLVGLSVVAEIGNPVTILMGNSLSNPTVTASFVASPNPFYASSADPTHVVNFLAGSNTDGLSGMLALFNSGEFYAQAFDQGGDSLISNLADQNSLYSSVAVTDTSGNTDTVAVSDTTFLDTTADLGSDFGLTVASVVNDAGSGSVQITLAGIDADVTTGGSIVVELANATEVDENGPVTGATVVTATHSGGNVWTANAQSLADGTIVVNAKATDAAGNIVEDTDTFLLDATAPVQLTGLDVANDNGVASDDNLTNDPSLTTPAGQGDETGGGTEASSTTYYALSNAGAGTTGWVTTPSSLVSSMNEGDTGNSNTVYYKQIDGAGNESAVSSYTFAYDNTDPTVSAASGLTSPSGTDTDGTVAFTLTFSEPVDVSTVVAADDLTISGGSIVSVTPVSETGGAATQFTVTATGAGDAGSSLDLAIKVGAAFSDRAGNETTLTSAVSHSAAIDTVHPAVTAFSTTHTAGDHVKAGETINISATLSESVEAGSKITVSLSSGGTAVLTTTAAGSTLTGTYTVLATQDAATLSVNSFALGDTANGGADVPKDLAGNLMTDTTVPTSNLAGAGIEVDTTADADTNFSVTVAATDKVANAAESTSVDLTLDGVDSDAVSVSVVVTDNATPTANSVTYAATRIAGTDEWTVADANVSGLNDGTLTVTATVTDDAGNIKSVTDTLALDTVVHPDTGLAVIEADATLAELQSGAASLTLESGATATVTLKGSEFAAASARKAAADTALGNAQTAQGNAFDNTYGTHSVNSVVDGALSLSHVDVTPTTWSSDDITKLGEAKDAYIAADNAVTTAQSAAATAFDNAYGTPSEGVVVTSAVTVGTFSLSPAAWTSENIAALQALRDAATDPTTFDSDNNVSTDTLTGDIVSPAVGDVIASDVTIGTLTLTAATWSSSDITALGAAKDAYIGSDSAVTTAQASAATAFDNTYGTPSAGDVVTSTVTVGTVSLSPTLWSSQDVTDLATDRAAYIVTNTATEAGAVQTAATDMANATVTLILTGTGSEEAITLTGTQVTALGDGTVNIGVTAVDSTGNPATDAAVSLTIDTVLPEITAISAVGDPVKTSGAYKAGDEIDFTVTLSENVQANGALRLTLNTGETVTVSTSAAGNSLTGTYTVGSSITDVADLEVDSIALGSATDTNVPTDIAGNAMGSVSVSSNDYKFTSIEVDTTAPAALTGIGLSGDTGGTGFDSDVITSNSALTSPTNAGAETGGGTETGYTVYYALSNVGAGTSGWTDDYSTLVSSLNDGNIGDPNDPHANTVYFKQIDAAGNESTIGSFSFKLDSSGPLVQSLDEPANSPTDLDGAVTFKLTLSEPVQSGTVTADDFEATTTENSVTSAPFAVTSVTPVADSLNQGGYTEFEVVATGSGDVGTVMELALKAGAKFADLAGNETTLSQILETTSIDTVHPTITAISAVGGKASGAYKAGDEIDFTVTLSENVQANGALRLTLNTGETVTVSTSAAGNSLTGTYTVKASGSVTDVADLEVSSIALGSADNTNVPTDIAGNAMGSVTVSSNDYKFTSIEIDTTAPNRPTIDGMSDDTNLTTDGYTSDTVLELTVTGEAGGTVTLYETISTTTTEVTGYSVTEDSPGTYKVTTSTLAPLAHGYASDLSVTITDPAGNVSQGSVVKSVEIDTVAPTVAITAIGNASGIITEIGGNSYHTITGTAEPNRDVKLSFPTDDDHMITVERTVTADSGGNWSYTLNNADMIVIGQGAGRSVTASQMDLAGNVGHSATTSFKMYTETKIAADGTVDESQLTAGLGHPDTVEGGTVITGSSGNLSASDDVIDLSASTNNVTYQGSYGEVWVDDGTTVKKAYIDPAGDFEKILTGSGDDLLIGLDGVSEVFNPGAGDNTVIAGDTAGDFDVLDYSQLTGSAGSVTTAAAANVTDGKEFTLGAGWNSKDLVVLNLGNGQSFAAATSQYATLALLVAALESQIEAVAGDVVSSTSNDVTNTVTLTANAGASQADALAILQASEVLIGDAGGIYGDLNPVASVNVHSAYTGNSGKIIRSDGGLDEVLGIEGVLGTAFEDILVGDDLENYLAGGAGDDILAGQGGADTLLGEAGDDYIYGGDGDDRIIGGADNDQLFGGAGRDVYVVDIGSVDTIRDFGVSAILSSQAGRGGVNDQVEFNFTNAELQAIVGSTLPATVELELALVKITEYQYTLTLSTKTPAGLLGEVDLDWGTVEGLFGSLDPADYDLNAFLPAGGVLTTGAGPYDIKATLEFVRTAQVDDAAGSQVLVGQGTSDDIFVSTQGDDVVIGGLGEDTYETRILGVTGVSAINNGTETLNDLGGVGEVDTIFFEGVRDLGDLDFDRVAIRREGDGRSLEVTYNQYRGVDDPDTAADETDLLHATGKVEVFNQFSLSQSDLYAIEGLEIAKETDNPLDAAVHRYVFGEVSESAASGDILSASADEDTILIGTKGKIDEFRITAPTDSAEHTEAWIYGMHTNGTLDTDEDVIIELNGSAQPTVTTTDVTVETLADGGTVQKVSITFDQGDGAGANDAILDLFFADAGNVNSTDLIDRIKFES
jgi:hypothetical protein